MARVNPCYWIARIMITWSIVTGCMATISQPWHFYFLRFLLVNMIKERSIQINLFSDRYYCYLLIL